MADGSQDETAKLREIVTDFYRLSLVFESCVRYSEGRGSQNYKDALAAVRKAEEYIRVRAASDRT